MLLLVSSMTNIQTLYGQDGFKEIQGALNRYARVLESRGFPSRLAFVDDHLDTGQKDNGPLLTTDWSSVRRALHRIAARQASLGRTVKSVVIVGGDRIMPFCRLPNPVVDRDLDPDTVVYSDDLYRVLSSGADQAWLMHLIERSMESDVAVGRILDGQDGKIETFVENIEQLIRNHQNPRHKSGACLVINREWREHSSNVSKALSSHGVQLRESPGYRVHARNKTDLSSRYLYFNLHGFIDEPGWKGYDTRMERYVRVLGPPDLDEAVVAGSTIFCENCYGAYVLNKTSQNSCAMKVVREGASSFIGPTGLAYGSFIAPNMPHFQRADRLAGSFFREYTSGSPSGIALAHAKRNYGKYHSLGTYEKKTVLQFVLFGDPLL